MVYPTSSFNVRRLIAGGLRLGAWIFSGFWILIFEVSASAAVLQIQVTPKFNGDTIEPSSLRYQTAAGESFSITRVSYLLSDFALQRNDGAWLEISNSAAWLDLGENRDTFRLENIPPGEYRAVHFSLGLGANLNHADPAQFPARHPLNPNFNGLYWSWQGGYIFLALEGLWRNAEGALDGWAYHLARDPNCTRIILAVPLEITNLTRLELDFDIATLLNAPHPLSFAKDGKSTHSRSGDPVAAALAANLPGAFRIHHVSALTDAEIEAIDPKPLYLPKKFTPYRFEMSATFPIPDLPRDNPLITERVDLGRTLFFEKQLSTNNRQSCADCHQVGAGMGDHKKVALGAEGQAGTRNAMPLFNLAWKKSFFWDGRSASLREQALQPIQNPLEMHETLTNVVTKLAHAKYDYATAFARAFGSPEITPEKISLALEQYVLVQTSFNSKFDRVQRGEEQFTPTEQRGFELFATEYDPRRGQYGADCFHCHGGPLFQSQGFANNGLDDIFKDPGRAQVTGRAADLGKFAVPSLRNIALTAPYMHDGRFQTLDQVIEHYATGVKRSATLDPNLAKHPDGGLPLTAADKQALVAFLKTLTDEKYEGDAAYQ
jgi:cytochrome c peroxidase